MTKFPNRNSHSTSWIFYFFVSLSLLLSLWSLRLNAQTCSDQDYSDFTIGCGSSRVSAVAPSDSTQTTSTRKSPPSGAEPSGEAASGLGNQTLGRWLGDEGSSAPHPGAPGTLQHVSGEEKPTNSNSSTTALPVAASGGNAGTQPPTSGHVKPAPNPGDNAGGDAVGGSPTKLVLSGGKLSLVEVDMAEGTPIYHSIFQLQNTTAPQEPR